jgi:hypothetical protein
MAIVLFFFATWNESEETVLMLLERGTHMCTPRKQAVKAHRSIQ